MKKFELLTRTLAKRSKARAVKLLMEQGVKPDTYSFVFHKDLKQYCVFAGSRKVAVIKEGTEAYTMAVMELVDPNASEDAKKVVGEYPPVTDWSKFDQGQIWEVYQGLANGVDVSGFVNPLIPATEMCAMRLAAQ